jgi:hypothetical protein
MQTFARLALIALVTTSGLALGGCETIENITAMLDTKKKLPGDRKPVFPEGVPGVQQGVPPELQRGYKEPEPTPPAEEEPKQAQQPAPAPERPQRAAQPRPQPQRTSQPQPAAQPQVRRPAPQPAAMRPAVEPVNVPEAPPPQRPAAQARAPAPADNTMQGRWPDQEPAQSQQQSTGGTRPWPDQQQQQQAPAWPTR